ncbi:MAG: argininosuccinate synthase [candidate division WOR-3 bacterium]
MKKVLLSYSGGLDTSVAIKMIEEEYDAEVYTLTVDVGQKEDLEAIRKKALYVGARDAFVFDGQEEFVQDYIIPAIKANALYEGVYPLATALARPLIVKHLVARAESIGAECIAHGCTGKGNDQVRFEAGIAALMPSLQVIAPMRQFNLKRDYELEYAHKHGIPVETKAVNYSIDENLWGRSIECGVLEDADQEPPEDAYSWTRPPEDAPAQATYIDIEFQAGVPVKLNGESMGQLEMIRMLNQLGGINGIGRIDHIESRLVGIKSREVYEAPAAVILIKAHQDLEKLTLPRDVLHFKPVVEALFAELVYNGLWFSPLRKALSAFIDETQQNVTGKVRMKLFKGSAIVVGRSSAASLYVKNLATYEGIDEFDQNSARGFIEIWSLPLKVYNRVNYRKQIQADPVLISTRSM